MEALLPALIGACVLMAAAAAGAVMFRWARIPGGAPAAAVAGGVLAGILLGPSVAWRAAPEWSQRYLRGGAAAQQVLVEHHRTMQREMAATEAALPPQDVERRAAELREQRDRLEARLLADRRAELDARIWLLLLALSSALALVGWTRAARPGYLPGASRPPAPGSGAAAAGSPRPAAPRLLALSLPGAAMALITALLSAAILRWGAGSVGGLHPAAALATGGAFAAGAILGRLQLPGRRIGAAADRLGLACLFASTAIVAAGALGEPAGRPWALALPAGALLLGSLAGWVAPGASRSLRAAARESLLMVGAPGAIGLAAAQVDLEAVAGGWRPVLAIVLLAALAGSGQLAGAWLGLLAGGWRSEGAPGPLRVALETNCAGLGLAQACGGLILLAVGAVEPWTPAASVVLAALLLSGLTIELTAPATLRMWRRLSALP